MAIKKFQERSREPWGAEENTSLSIDRIQLGAILRIAEAQEKMQISICGLERIAKLETEVKNLKSAIRKLKSQQ